MYKVMPPPFLTIFGLVVTLIFFNSKSKQLIFVAQCTRVVNLAKFPQLVYEIACSQNFRNAHTDGQNLKTYCLQQVTL